MCIKTDKELFIRIPNSAFKIYDSISKGDVPLTDYPIKYSALTGKPSIQVNSDGTEQWGGNTDKNFTVKTFGALDLIGSSSANLSSMTTTTITGEYGVVLSTQASIQIKDASTKGSAVKLQDYPKSWSKISNKPRASNLFGYVLVKAVSSGDPDEYWPAVALKDSYNHTGFSVYKFNGSQWVKGTSSEFISFNDKDPNEL